MFDDAIKGQPAGYLPTAGGAIVVRNSGRGAGRRRHRSCVESSAFRFTRAAEAVVGAEVETCVLHAVAGTATARLQGWPP